MRNAPISCTIVALLGAAATLGGCNSSVEITSPTPTSSSAMSFLEIPVDPGSNGVDAFELSLPEYARITLAGIVGSDKTKPIDVTMGVRVGLFTETGCSADNPALDQQVKPSFVAQLGAVMSLGTYCVEVYDIGNLTEPVTVMMRVVHPPPVTSTRNATDVSGSNVTVSGASSRTFDVTGPGLVNVTLTDLQPNVPTGLGIGFQQTDGTGCRLTRSVVTTARNAPAHFSEQFDPGTYCVQVFDVGNYTRTTSYLFRIEHP